MEPKAPVQISQLKFEQDRRKKLAEVLGKGADRQVGSHLDGLAKVLQMGMAGYQTRKADEAGKSYEDAKREALQKALDPSISRDERIKTLGSVDGYEGDAVKASLETPSNTGLKDQAEQELLKMQRGQPYDANVIQAFDKLRSTELMYDPRQNIVAKYGSLLGNQAPSGARAAPIPAQGNPQPVEAPDGGMPPQPTLGKQGQMLSAPPATAAEMGGRLVKPDQNMFNQGTKGVSGTAVGMPSGLDPKAQGQYMDAVAASAAERANNGGLPKMTAEQSQANVRGTILGSSLQNLEKLMFDPEIDAGRMAGAKTIGDFMPDSAGPFVQNLMMNPKEQLFDSSMAGAKESLAGAMTGAAFTEQQAKNFTAMLPNGTEAPEIRKQKLADAYRYAIAVTEGAGAAGMDSRQNFTQALQRLQQEQQATSQNASQAAGGLTPQEQAEYEQLKKMFGGQ